MHTYLRLRSRIRHALTSFSPSTPVFATFNTPCRCHRPHHRTKPLAPPEPLLSPLSTIPGVGPWISMVDQLVEQRVALRFSKASASSTVVACANNTAATLPTFSSVVSPQRVRCIHIKAGDTGFGYSTVFGPYLDNNITDATVQDPYIKAKHQVHNFVRFCELLVQRCEKLHSIILITTQAESTDQNQWLGDLRESLKERNVLLEIHFSTSLHDREIRFSNGWIVKIGRGLDYFQKPKGQFTIGFSNYELRPCLETTIETFHRLNTHFVHTKQ